MTEINDHNGHIRKTKMRLPNLVLFLALLYAIPSSAERGFLVVHVSDAQGRPITGIQIAVKGDGGNAYSSGTLGAKARIRLAPDTKANSNVSIYIVSSPHGHDYVLVSPWDGIVRVPSFENESENFVSIVVAERGDRAMLESGNAIKAMAALINKTNSSADGKPTPKPNRSAIEEVSHQFGLPPDEVDQAIRAWGARARDPYEKGLAALYASDYPLATEQLTRSVEVRRQQLLRSQEELFFATFFLAESLYEQQQYRESATRYKEALEIRPDDPAVLNNLAVDLRILGDFNTAEMYQRRGIAIAARTLGEEHPLYARDLSNLALLLSLKGNFKEAEALFQQALAIDEKVLGRNHPETATSLNNLAELYQDESNYAAAEPLLERALAIRQQAFGPNDPQVANSLNNLAILLQSRGDYQRSEAMLRQALSIRQKVLPPNDLEVANSLANLGAVLLNRGEYVESEKRLRDALSIYGDRLGSDNPESARCLNNLGTLLKHTGRLKEAQGVLQRALRIVTKAFGSNHPDTAMFMSNLAQVLESEGDLDNAEKMFRQVLEVNEGYFGPDNLRVATSLNNLAVLLQKKGKFAESEPLLRRALKIRETNLGPAHPDVANSLFNLALVLEAKCDYNDAIPLYRRAFEILTNTFGGDNPTTIMIRNGLETATERSEEAQKGIGRCRQARRTENH